MSLSERYELIEVIARGNMGVVYRALDRRLDRVVALKQILGGESEQDRARFLREAEVVARLSHPHIVSVHDYGEEEGHPWMALEHLLGETLSERIRRAGPLSSGETLELGLALSGALAHAHQAGVLHRDIKPDNVMLVDEQPYLVDFGLARLVSRTTRLTASQDLVGTPAFMSPEQATGDHPRIGPPTDLYGLCATLYFCLTGRAPLIGSTLLDTLQKITSEIPIPVTSGLPGLDAVIARGLAKDPRQRFPSADDLSASLRDVHSQPLAPERDERRRPLLVPGAAAVLALLCLGVLGVFSYASPSAPTPAEAMAPSPSPTSSRAPSGSPSPLAESPSPPSPSPSLRPTPDAPPLPGTPLDAARKVLELGEALELRRAHALLAAARERWPEDEELRVWTTAWLHAQLGSWSAARAAFEEAAALDVPRLGRLCRLPGDSRLYPAGNDLRRLSGGSSNLLLFETRWTPWLGARWRFDGDQLACSQAGIGTFNLSVAIDERAPRRPRFVEVEVNLAPTGERSKGYAGIFLAGQSAREFFCLFLVDNPREVLYRRSGGSEAYRKRTGSLPVFARLTHQRGARWEFPLRYSKVAPQTSAWVRLRAEFAGTRVRVSIGAALVADVELGRAAEGRFGLLKFYEVPIEFRSWKIG